jgi:hypothetical protein
LGWTWTVPGGLSGSLARLAEAFLGKQRLAGERPVLQFLVDLELVLPLQRDEDPVLRVKIDVPWLKTKTPIRSNRDPIGEDAVFVAKYL